MIAKTFALQAQRPYGLVLTPAQGTLSYSPQDTLALRLELGPNYVTKISTWTLSRELLTKGVHHRVGKGEVQVWPVYKGMHWRVNVSISNVILVRFARKELKAFLKEISLGEAYDQRLLETALDRELDLILRGGKN